MVDSHNGSSSQDAVEVDVGGVLEARGHYTKQCRGRPNNSVVCVRSLLLTDKLMFSSQDEFARFLRSSGRHLRCLAYTQFKCFKLVFFR